MPRIYSAQQSPSQNSRRLLIATPDGTDLQRDMPCQLGSSGTPVGRSNARAKIKTDVAMVTDSIARTSRLGPAAEWAKGSCHTHDEPMSASRSYAPYKPSPPKTPCGRPNARMKMLFKKSIACTAPLAPGRNVFFNGQERLITKSSDRMDTEPTLRNSLHCIHQLQRSLHIAHSRRYLRGGRAAS
jgi:hypothetical protein